MGPGRARAAAGLWGGRWRPGRGGKRPQFGHPWWPRPLTTPQGHVPPENSDSLNPLPKALRGQGPHLSQILEDLQPGTLILHDHVRLWPAWASLLEGTAKLHSRLTCSTRPKPPWNTSPPARRAACIRKLGSQARQGQPSLLAGPPPHFPLPPPLLLGCS
jgi:hypothetical protein